MANGIGPAIFGGADEFIDAIDYTTTAILVWVNASHEEAARKIVEEGTTFAGLLWVDEYTPGVYLFTFDGAENA